MNRPVRFLFALTLACFGAGTSAQIVFQEDFDGMGGPTAGGAGTYSFPIGWTLVNVDNRTPEAAVSYVNEAWERREDFNFNVVDSAAFSTSWYAPVGAADDWMWTPAIAVGTSNVLSWNAVAYDAMFQDGYEVRIMVDPNVPTGTTGNLGNMVTQSTVLFTTPGEASAWTAHTVSLSAYAGQTVRIAFRNNANDKFLLLIDDVVVEQQLNIDAQMLFADTATEYTIIPVAHGAPLNFNGTLRNNGLNALVDARAEVTVLLDGAQVFQDFSVAAGLAAGATAPWTAPSYTPTAVGTYMVRFVAQQNSGTDQQPLNDTLWQGFVVTDSIYARDDGNVVGGLGIGAGNGGYLGQAFDLVQDDVITSVMFHVTRGYANRQAAAVIWNTVGGVPDQIIAGTDTILYPDDSSRVYTIPLPDGGSILTAGRYVVTMVEFDSTLQVSQTMNVFTRGTCWVNWPTNPFGGWTNVEAFGAGFERSFVIRPNFGDPCDGISATANVVNASCGTCNDGSMSVTVTGANGDLSYDWNTGETTAVINNLLPGPYQATIIDELGCVIVVDGTVTFSTNVIEAIGATNVMVLPNPSNGPFALRLQFAQATDVDVDLYTPQGQLVEARHIGAHVSGDVAFSGEYAAGSYTLMIRTAKGSITRPLTIVR